MGKSRKGASNLTKIGNARGSCKECIGRWNFQKCQDVQADALGSHSDGSMVPGPGGLVLTGIMLSKATLKALNASQADLNTQISPRERKIRSIYRTIIIILSLYFYISISFVIILLLLVVGVVFYIFGMIGTIPIYFVGILLIMLFGSFFAILRSIFSRKKDQIPGRALSRMDAPELWKLVEDVAHRLEVQPVESIQITPDAGIGVYEKGSIMKKMRGKGKRKSAAWHGSLRRPTQGGFAGIPPA